MKKRSKKDLLKAVFGCFFMIISMFWMLSGAFLDNRDVYAVPVEESVDESVVDENANDVVIQNNDAVEADYNDVDTDSDGQNTQSDDVSRKNCRKSLGAVSWLVCPVIEKIADAVDWLYEKIEDILIINPISTDDTSPVYLIWQYCLRVTNIVFIIFLLVVVYSQLTGLGISNYGIKKALPKLIVAAVLINLSFFICSLGIELSNIVGNGLRGVFTMAEESAMAAGATSDAKITFAGTFGAFAAGTALTVGAGAVALEFGVIWMLIPVILGAIASVVTGLITIALRQAVVILLIMISPLAIVANILPNTEQWFKKWKQLLIRMLVFYPVFSLLFGASSLAGFALIMGAKNGFGILLGLAVQVFPLIYSWKLMQMSGTILGGINSWMRGVTAKPLAANRAWADSHRQLKRSKALTHGRTPSARLMQFMSNRKIAREEELSDHAAIIKNRGLAYNVSRRYKNGVPTREAEREYAAQAKNMEYERIIERHKNNMNKGLGQLEAVSANASRAKKARLNKLDIANVEAADALKMEVSRGAKIEYDNISGYYNRIKDAMYANEDDEALRAGNLRHQMHGVLDDRSNLARYDTMKKVMEGNELDIGFIAADAAYTFGSQSQIVRGKFGSHFEYTEATQDIVNYLNRMTKTDHAGKYIDPIIAGMRTLNMRGDTDLALRQLDNVLRSKDVEIGSHAMQAIANYCMFDVKGNDPGLRRLGKYINLQTAKMFNEDDPEERRTRKDISLYEYINGEYIDRDADGRVLYDDNGQPIIKKTSKNAPILLKGTPIKDMERTAIKSLDEMIRMTSVDLSLDENENEIGTFNYDKFSNNEKKIWGAMMPNVVGDHFSFLSGSEQIVAVGKGLTGIDVKKHAFDWKGMFGEEVANNLSTDQKKEYIRLMHERTKSFLASQVPIQIARTKTDMLEAIKIQYALNDAVNNDPEFLERVLDPNFSMTDDEYSSFEAQHMDGIKSEFVGSFKRDALKGFLKMHNKGYQGEAKDGLIQLLDPDRLYAEYFPNGENGNRNRTNNVNDDAPPTVFDDELGNEFGIPVYNDTRSSIESTFSNYRGEERRNVSGFWNDVKPIIRNYAEAGNVETVIDYFENRISQYTDVSALYADIINQVFGGFGT